MSADAPPSSVVNAVELFAPGFWRSWSQAVEWCHYQSGGVTYTSWWRSPSWNQEVGGSESSQHLVGVALDVVPRDWARAAAAYRAAGFQVVNDGDHLHVQPWSAGVARSSGLLSYLGW